MVKGNKNHGSQRDCEVKGIVVSPFAEMFSLSVRIYPMVEKNIVIFV